MTISQYNTILLEGERELPGKDYRIEFDESYNQKMAISQIQIKSLDHLLTRRQEVTASSTLPVGLPDSAAYYFLKEASFLSKKEDHWSFYFFQGLNTNPQNLSIFLRDEAQRQNKHSKQKLVKGVFVVFDLFSKCDVVIQINIPGNLKIFKIISHKKELVSNEEIDLMYLSSAFRTMYQQNMVWGRSYLLFHDSKNYKEDLKSFIAIAFRCLLKRDLNLGPEFESQARVKGSHGCSLILTHLKERKLGRAGIEFIEQIMSKNEEYAQCPKYGILLAELYNDYGKPSKSLETVFSLLKHQPKEALLLYYEAKYLLESGLYDQALLVANSLVQYNQFEIWLLLAQIHVELKNFPELLICLNHASKMSKVKIHKQVDWSKPFQELGKIRQTTSVDGIEYHPRLLFSTDSPLGIQTKQVEQKNKFMIERGYWRLNQHQKQIYNIVQDVRYRLQTKKFEELLMNTFEDNIAKYEIVSIKKGITETIAENTPLKLIQETEKYSMGEEVDDLPQFLKNSIDKVQESITTRPNRNLSIIPEIESVIQNSNYEQKQKQKTKKKAKLKRQVSETLFRVIQLILSQTDFQKAEYQNNIAKTLQVYNKMRTSSKFNTYYADLMFKIFMQTSNYKSMIVLIAETLDLLEQRGVKKMDKLPYWMHKYLFFIIEEKGLKFLNDMLEKLNFYDEAVIDTIELAKKWKMKGVTY